jgi:hypothetical protein
MIIKRIKHRALEIHDTVPASKLSGDTAVAVGPSFGAPLLDRPLGCSNEKDKNQNHMGTSAIVFDLLRDLLSALQVHIPDHDDIGALLAQRQCDGPTDAGRSACHQSDLPVWTIDVEYIVS